LVNDYCQHEIGKTKGEHTLQIQRPIIMINWRSPRLKVTASAHSRKLLL